MSIFNIVLCFLNVIKLEIGHRQNFTRREKEKREEMRQNLNQAKFLVFQNLSNNKTTS
eukprot:TRINITY_DN3160_c2_g1_i1.p1 TRINITY_DN3160_c2_g1~~TRINITY_DN3160_c2_g1_i1.p1  ORF type:complete len:58 (-),score=10.41 TRINITY_DN3160_c2_g1_i1:52-225(-)